MQNDGSLSVHLRRNYRHLRCVEKDQTSREELRPNTSRCGMMTSYQIASYGGFWNVATTGIHDGHPGLHLSAFFLAAQVATTLCNLIDVIKSQLMGLSNKTPYSYRGNVMVLS